ncbi:MAG: hypothetical protein KatS3mg087_1456 [Patescibacteria group bacterium]|nr:MAG: hypothetical protein KatS3mg087_1456 [Patescibacteria group bacterium]
MGESQVNAAGTTLRSVQARSGIAWKECFVMKNSDRTEKQERQGPEMKQASTGDMKTGWAEIDGIESGIGNVKDNCVHIPEDKANDGYTKWIEGKNLVGQEDGSRASG